MVRAEGVRRGRVGHLANAVGFVALALFGYLVGVWMSKLFSWAR